MTQNSINIALPDEGMLLNIFVFTNVVFPLNALMFAHIHCGASTFHHLSLSVAEKPFFLHGIAIKTALFPQVCVCAHLSVS